MLESFRQKHNVEAYIMRGISLCMFILDYYATCDSSSARYKQILVEMDRAVRAAYGGEIEAPGHLGQLEEINQLLFSNVTTAAPSGSATPQSTVHYLSSSQLPQLQSTVSVSAQDSRLATPTVTRRQEEDLWYREFSRRSGELGGSGDASASSGSRVGSRLLGGASTPTSNLSAMFLRSAANSGMYQTATASERGGHPAAAVQDLIRIDEGSRLLSPTEMMLSANQEVVPELSPSEAMEQFLTDETFDHASTSANSMDYMFDLEIDWLNAAVADAFTGNRTAVSGDASKDMTAVDATPAPQTVASAGAMQSGGVEGLGSSNSQLVLRGLMLNSEF